MCQTIKGINRKIREQIVVEKCPISKLKIRTMTKRTARLADRVTLWLSLWWVYLMVELQLIEVGELQL